MRYAVVVHERPGSTYEVTVSDLSVCFSGGNTLGAVIPAIGLNNSVIPAKASIRKGLRPARLLVQATPMTFAR